VVDAGPIGGRTSIAGEELIETIEGLL